MEQYLDFLTEEKARLVKSIAAETHEVLKSKSKACYPTIIELRDHLNNQ